MSVFLLKALTLMVKTLARPLINWVSYYNRLKMQESNKKHIVFIRNKLITLGNNFNYYNTLFNRKLFKLSDKQPIKPLSDDKALERGAELISETIVYSILLIVPTLEMIRSYKNSKKKEEDKKQIIVKIQKNVEILIENHSRNMLDVSELKHVVNKFNREIYLV
jgi:hypothetical protein